MNTLEQDLKEAIKKNLPAQAAGELKKFIEEAEQTKSDLEDTKEVLESTRKKLAQERKINQDMSEKLVKQQEMDKREEDCTKREEEVSIRERDIQLELAQNEINMLNAKNQNTHELVAKVFGHPSVTVNNSSSREVMGEVDEYGNTKYNPSRDTLQDDSIVKTTHSKE